MKKKSVFLSKVFAVALAASMAFSTPYASAELVTESIEYGETGKQIATKEQGWWSNWSDFYRVSGDFDVTFEIACKGNGQANYTNVNTILSSAVDYAEGDPNNIPGYIEYLVARTDNWCWSQAGDNITREGIEVIKECNWNFDTMPVVMTDAKVTINVKRTGNACEINMTVLGSDNNTYNQSYKFTTKVEDDLNIFFGGDLADVSILSYKNNASTEPDTTEPTEPDTTAPEEPTEPTPEEPTEPVPEEPTAPEEPSTTEPAPEEPDTTEPEAPTTTTTTKTVKLNKTTASIKVGGTVKLKVKNTTKTVTWSSSKKKVAKVTKAGKVTGLKAGTTTIKAKVGNKTLKCKVTVKK